ncbi:hypothetical protein IF090_10715 [Acinetobacter towneri]|jgi:hypothetical protein|uniref:hypothetical protein n=1 Tax=Acinetobacter TaxID=469 RepID=UPI0014448ACD|nr:hypothetical protein [Acinetobacter towneri]MCA4780098.1 hypothetical protein [Acinetobacter towneri]MCA4785490.1 hypothetical protein [Acinetobacter towneri]MCA4788515.1 hypothetical protein [Acinetobacter towneri]MCA4796608.1 hypothetical protein [Acinetobacter towneri]MCA4801655.1 hypothetical protein [Acinetobacter towneri]
MLKNVIKSYSFFYQFFLKTQQSQDRQGLALKATCRKNKQIIFKNYALNTKMAYKYAVLPQKRKVWAAFEASPKLRDRSIKDGILLIHAE